MPENDPKMMTTRQALEQAIQHQQAGRLTEAEKFYRQILTDQPRHAQACYHLGKIAQQRGELSAAVDLFRRAIAAKPSESTFYNSLGVVFMSQRRLDESIATFRTLLELNPDYAPAYNNLGIALHTNGQLQEAAAEFRRALQLKPDYPQAHHNLGNILQSLGQYGQAVEAYRRALKLKPDYPEAHNNLGIVLYFMRQFDAAIAESREALRLKPDYAGAHVNLGNVLEFQGLIREALAEYKAALRINPNDSSAHGSLILALHYHPDFDAQAIYQEQRRWNGLHAEPLKKFIRPHVNPDSHRDDPTRRLKIGYVSADFCNHTSAYYLDPLLRSHDHQQYEIICYNQVARPDDLTRQFQSYADQWRNIAGLSDEATAEQIRRDGIDILVDLKLHTNDNRLLVFAYKPAPVQVTWLGYPGGTGMETMDYRLSDPFMDPPDTDLSVYSEQTLRLEHCFWCYDPLANELPIHKPPVLQNGHVTFGCLNNFCKVNDRVLELWARVLAAVPHSRLMLLAPEGQTRQRVFEKFLTQGIQAGRVECFDRLERLAYLELYNRIDLVLDTFPYNGHTTSLDSLWMGVPVVTLSGQTAAGRGGRSILSNVGLTELIAQTPEEYVAIAVKLASDLPRLAELHRTLRQRMEASPLMDAPSFARNVEAAYRVMWRRWLEKQGV
jgi:protein O-GlcNAc transferase